MYLAISWLRTAVQTLQWQPRLISTGTLSPAKLTRMGLRSSSLVTLAAARLHDQRSSEDGENIEYWMGGRWGDAAEFNTLGDMVMVAITGVKRFEFGVHN